jgi:hypothetical protein
MRSFIKAYTIHGETFMTEVNKNEVRILDRLKEGQQLTSTRIRKNARKLFKIDGLVVNRVIIERMLQKNLIAPATVTETAAGLIINYKGVSKWILQKL